MSSPGTNTSASGGPMTPQPTPAPLEGSALLDIIQETLVALTGLDPTLVRPRDQTEPPNIPTAGTCWLAFGIQARPSDTVPVIQHDPAGNAGLGQDDFQRQEELRVLCSFYDTGSSGLAYGTAALLRDGLSVPQNMEALQIAANINLGWTGELTPLPVVTKMQWQYRVDMMICFRRQIDRVYRTENQASAGIGLKANTPGDQIITANITVNPPP